MHITSIGQNHPGFAQNPHIQDIKGSEEVNASIIIGTPVNPLAAADAASTVKHISGAESSLPGVVTNDTIETARNRAHVLRDTHAASEFGLQPGVGLFVQQQFADFREELRRINARITNSQIQSRNRRFPRNLNLPQALQKIVAGNGHALALAIWGQGASLPADAQNFHPNAVIGDVPQGWDGHIAAFQHIHILRLVIFYNDDFGIVMNDKIPSRREKLRTWLLEQVYCK